MKFTLRIRTPEAGSSLAQLELAVIAADIRMARAEAVIMPEGWRWLAYMAAMRALTDV